MDERSVEKYLSLPYTIEIIRENDPENPGWVARVVELPGCLTQADTFDELGEMIGDAMHAWIETALEDGMAIPEPRPIEEHSGKFVVRVPKSLHRELVNIADREGVSLNSLVNVALGKAVGATNAISTQSVEPKELPIINWPHLSTKARQVLILNGCADEAQKVDEKFFAGWIQDYLNRAYTAMQTGYYREAVDYLYSLRRALEILCDQSPTFSVFCQMASILENQVQESFQIRQGIIESSMLQQRIHLQVQSSSQRTSYRQSVENETNIYRQIQENNIIDEDSLRELGLK